MSLELIKLKNKEINFLKDENKVLKKRVEEFEIKIETAFHNGVKNGNEAMRNKYDCMTCESCKYFNPSEGSKRDGNGKDWIECDLLYVERLNDFKDFCCNKWESK